MSEPLIVEVDGYDGEDGHILVENYRAERGMGRPNIIYCIGELEPGGIVRISDWGYATIEEAREAIGFRKSAQERAQKGGKAR
jgi:hypothetical protein